MLLVVYKPVIIIIKLEMLMVINFCFFKIWSGVKLVEDMCTAAKNLDFKIRCSKKVDEFNDDGDGDDEHDENIGLSQN